jgi:hypothetical protein
VRGPSALMQESPRRIALVDGMTSLSRRSYTRVVSLLPYGSSVNTSQRRTNQTANVRTMNGIQVTTICRTLSESAPLS